MIQNQDDSNFVIEDRIFLGEGLFETVKVLKGRACVPMLHWRRLSNAAQNLNINFTLTEEEWCFLLRTTIQKENLVNGGIKIILSGGVAPRGLLEQGHYGKLLTQPFEYTRQNVALRLLPASWARDENNPIYQFKTINYLESILARREARRRGADDAWFFNTKNHATEATCSNLFIIINKCLITPPLQDGIVPGITRQRIISHCSRLGIRCEELSVGKELLEQADTIFLTNSLQGIQYVKSMDSLSFAITNPLVEQLMQALAEEEQGSW